jgi:ribosomal-protein-alanine N-acetyltransferase
MDGRYRIRPATDRDLAEVVAIEQGAFSDPWSEESFRSLLTHHAFVVVVNDREIVGYVFGVGVEDVGEILNVAVAHAHRQRGIGRALVEHARHSLVRSGVRQVFLEVRESNAAAQALYRTLAFELVGRRRRYYQQPLEDALVLKWVKGRGKGT